MNLTNVLQTISDRVPNSRASVEIRLQNGLYLSPNQAEYIIHDLTTLGGELISNDVLTQGDTTYVAHINLEGLRFNIWYERVPTKEEQIANLQKQIEQLMEDEDTWHK